MTLPETPTRTALRADLDALAEEVDALQVGPPPAHTHTIGQVTGLTDALAGKQAAHANLSGISGVGTVDEMIVFRHNGAWVRRTLAEFTAMLGITGGGASAPLFNIESHGAVADDTTDCYPAVLAAWNAMLAFAKGGKLFAPTLGVYRVVLNTARVQTWPDEQRAAYPIPMRPRDSTTKLAYGIQGAGEAYVVRTAELGGTPGQVATASVLRFDYNPADFAWSGVTGLPCVFGAPDADMTDPEGNSFSNIHFSVDDVILRSPVNPSLCVLNLEQVSTCRLGRVRFDVNAVLDQIPEPTRPTGAAYLLPRSNNNVAIEVDAVVVEGYYTGIAMSEHVRQSTGIALRCKIGAFTRRICSHASQIGQLKLEQCQFGFAGYNPAGTGPNLGIVAWQGWIGQIGMVDVEDYAYNGTVPWIYTPVYGSHIYDPLNRFNGNIAGWTRINSEPASPTGIGVGTAGQSNSLYVIGASGTNSPVAVWQLNNHTVAATRVLGTAPSNPPVAPPDTPTIGTATAGVESAQVTFTPAGSGEPATSFTATAYNGSNVAVGNATGASSPITISDLTAGVQVTIKVRANNVVGSSAESAASNAVTPTSGAGLPSDDFNRANATSLGTSSSGHAWQGDAADTFEIIDNRAEANTTGTAWNPAWLETGVTQQVVETVILHRTGERGLYGRVVDAANGIMLDYEYSGNSGNIAVYERVANSLTSRGSAVLSNVPDDTEVKLKLVLDGTNVKAYVHKLADPEGAPKIDATLGGSAPNGTKAGIYSLVTGTPHTVFDTFAVTAVTP